ncbi:MAG: hypothetical protein KF899_04190 [Parvibaculum sp.]|nr:hypothetical protein [Parvibaculum sp.]
MAAPVSPASFDRRAIMTRAWVIRRTTGAGMSEALRKAWAEAKAPARPSLASIVEKAAASFGAPVRRLPFETVDPYPARVSAAQVAVIARNTYRARWTHGAR